MKDFAKQVLINALATSLVPLPILLYEWVVPMLYPQLSLGQRVVPPGLFTVNYFYGVPLIVVIAGGALLLRRVFEDFLKRYGSGRLLNLGYTGPAVTQVYLEEQGILFEVDVHAGGASTATPKCNSCGCGLMSKKRILFAGLLFLCPACGKTARTNEPWSKTLQKVQLRGHHNYVNKIIVE